MWLRDTGRGKTHCSLVFHFRHLARGELKHESPMEAEAGEHGQMPQLVRADESGDKCRTVQGQHNRSRSIGEARQNSGPQGKLITFQNKQVNSMA